MAAGLIVDVNTNARAVYSIDPATGLPVTGGGAYTGPLAAQLPATLGAKTGAASLSVVWATDMTATQGTTAPTMGPQIFGLGSTTAPTAVTAGQSTRAWYSLNGAAASMLAASDGTVVPVSAPGATSFTRSVGLYVNSQTAVFNGTNMYLARSVTGALSTGQGTQSTAPAPHNAAEGAIVPIVTSAASGLVVAAQAANFYSGSMVAGITAGFFIAYNATAVPAPGALTAGLILGVVPVAANGFASFDNSTIPDRFGVGVVLLFSTVTTAYTVPATPALHIRGKAV